MPTSPDRIPDAAAPNEQRQQTVPTARPRRRAVWIILYCLGLLLLVEVAARITWRMVDCAS